MHKGKLIVIEGTDCSGKQTQAEMLLNRLKNLNIPCIQLGFPRYDTPTGRIVGGPYLGKAHIGEGFFAEGAANVDPHVASLYFAADRKYNIEEVTEYLNKGYLVILDRYTESNMAHQSASITDPVEREKMWQFLEQLEYGLLQLPKPDLTVFLHMPYNYALELKTHRDEKPDQLENNAHHLLNAENSYLQLCKRNGWIKITCIENNKIKSIEQIGNEIFEIINTFLSDK